MGKTNRPPKHALQEFSRDPAARLKTKRAKRKCAVCLPQPHPDLDPPFCPCVPPHPLPSRAGRSGRDLKSMTCAELLTLLWDVVDALGTKTLLWDVANALGVARTDDAPPDRRYERLRAAVLKLERADSGLNRANAWVAVNNALGRS